MNRYVPSKYTLKLVILIDNYAIHYTAEVRVVIERYGI